MAAILKIDGYDLASYLRVNQGDGLDLVDGDHLEPQWGEAAGGEGDPFISLHPGNAELVVPLHVTPLKTGDFADSIDGLHAMVTDLHRRLAAAAQAEWRMDGATSSTFYDVQHARFEPDFDYRRQAKLWCSGVLRIWAKPYGHTGTSRLAASAAGSGVALTLSPSGLSGDSVALVAAGIRGASAPIGAGRLTGYAAVPSGRVIDIPAASLTLAAGATLTGRADAAGSQVVLSPAVATGGGLAEIGRVAIGASAYAGRQRLLAVGAGVGRRLYAATDDGQQTDGVVIDSFDGIGYGTVDLGAINVDPANGATRTIFLYAEHSEPAGPFVSFFPRAAINRLLIAPEAETGLAVESHRTQIARDGFGSATPGDPAVVLATGVTDELGGEYSPIGVKIGYSLVSGEGVLQAASHVGLAQLTEIFSEPDMAVEVQCGMAAGPAPSARIQVGKRLADAGAAQPFFSARVHDSLPSTAGANVKPVLNIITGDSVFGTASVLASAAVPTLSLVNIASTGMRVRFSNRGPQITANLVLDTATHNATVLASLGASIALVATHASPFVGLAEASPPAGGFAHVHAWGAWSLASGAAPRDTITIDTGLRTAIRQAASGGAVAALTSLMRGDAPGLHPATAAQQIIALNLPAAEQSTTGILDATIRVKERFQFAR